MCILKRLVKHANFAFIDLDFLAINSICYTFSLLCRTPHFFENVLSKGKVAFSFTISLQDNYYAKIVMNNAAHI